MTIETETLEPAIPAAAFDGVLALIKLAADPKAFQARLDALMAAGVKARDLEVSAKRAVTAMQVREAALDAREAEIDGRQTAHAEAVVSLMHREEALKREARDLHQRETSLKYRMLRYFGLEEPGPLNSMASFEQIEADGAAEAALASRDPQYGDAETAVDVHESFAVPPLNLPPGATLTRSSAAQRRAQRRVDNPKH
jgi:hypothetical protein